MQTVTAIPMENGIHNMLIYEIIAYPVHDIIVLAGMLIHWSIKLQTEIALSSTEAEYISLSQCCISLLSMIRTLEDILSCGIFLKF
jgi:hypothetical protein